MKPRHPAPLNALRAFEAAARSGSFQAAAVQLFVTPAAVSHQVKQLEAYLGVKLFHRGHRLVELTPKGRELATSLGELFGQLELALDRATESTIANLRVSTVESFAAKWLAPRLHRFHHNFPDLKVRIDTSNEHADLAPSLLNDAGRPLAKPDDLRHHTLLHDESAIGRPGVPDWSAWLNAAGATRVDATHGPVFASIYLAQEAAVAGHGVALGVAPLVEEDLQRGRLVKPLEHSLDNAYAFWLLRRADADPNPAIDAFCQWLRTEAAPSDRSGGVHSP